MREVDIGKYYLGNQVYRVTGRSGTGGELYFWDGKSGLPQLVVGLDGEWSHVASVLLHEATEATLQNMGVRYVGAYRASNDQAAYLFSFDHSHLSEMCEIVGAFIVDCLPNLCQVYGEHKRKLRKKNGKR